MFHIVKNNLTSIHDHCEVTYLLKEVVKASAKCDIGFTYWST